MSRVLLICDGADPGALAAAEALLRSCWPGVERLAANVFAGDLSGKRGIDLPETLAHEGPAGVQLVWVRAEVIPAAGPAVPAGQVVRCRACGGVAGSVRDVLSEVPRDPPAADLRVEVWPPR